MTFGDELRHIGLNCDEWRRIERRLNEIETNCVGLVISLRHVERIEEDFKASGAMTGRLGDRLKRFRQVELSSSRV